MNMYLGRIDSFAFDVFLSYCLFIGPFFFFSNINDSQMISKVKACTHNNECIQKIVPHLSILI